MMMMMMMIIIIICKGYEILILHSFFKYSVKLINYD
jgi:hypothetical protein